MPLSTGRAKLFNGMKTLHAKWEGIQEVWDDSVRQDFEEHVWIGLEAQVQATLRGTDRLDQMLGQLFRDCE